MDAARVVCDEGKDRSIAVCEELLTDRGKQALCSHRPLVSFYPINHAVLRNGSAAQRNGVQRRAATCQGDRMNPWEGVGSTTPGSG